MHEFSICQSLVDAVVAETEKLDSSCPFRLLKARVVIGAMRQIVPEILQTAYELMSKDTIAANSALEIVSAPTTVKCRKCGWNGEIQGLMFQCADCGGTDIEQTGGMELYLDNLEIEPDGEN